jgi:two-component system chemotaxis response regulator CheB
VIQRPAKETRVVNVMVVEDSRVIRDYLVHALEAAPGLKVEMTAESGEEALALLEHRKPDIILMDIHLPGIDGIETTRRIMAHDPVPVVVCTGSTHYEQISSAIDVLEVGALSLLKKPVGFADPDSDAEIAAIARTLRLMAEVKVVRRWRPRDSAAVVSPASTRPPLLNGDFDAAVVAIGASTGGPPVVADILTGLPADFPTPILVVQHIAAGFMEGFARWLESRIGRPVLLAKDGDRPAPGQIFLPPEGRHLVMDGGGRLLTPPGTLQHGVRPSVGVLFASLASSMGARSVGVLLTGMGRDGAEELKLMADAGALTVAQDRESCVVFGMPGEAVKLGAAQHVLPPAAIRDLLLEVGQSTPGTALPKGQG